MGSNLSLLTNPNYHFLPIVCLVHLLISISWLLESLSLCPKVIPLSGAQCIYHFSQVRYLNKQSNIKLTKKKFWLGEVFLGIYSTCNNVRLLKFSTIFLPCFHLKCLKNSIHSGGLNPGTLNHESSALTTRPVFLNRRVATWKRVVEDFKRRKPLCKKNKFERTLFFAELKQNW
jgi:hypothetical protein